MAKFKYNFSWLLGLHIILAVLSVSLAIEEGQVQCLHGEFDKVTEKHDLYLCCVYRKKQNERAEHFMIQWENKSSHAKPNAMHNFSSQTPPRDGILIECIDISKEDYDDGGRFDCSVTRNRPNTNELVQACTIEIALFHNNPLNIKVVATLCWATVCLLAFIFLIVILLMFLKLLLKLCRKSGRHSFPDNALKEMTPRESVFYSRIGSISNSNMYGLNNTDSLAMINRSRFPTYLQVDVDRQENVIIDEEVYENASVTTRRPTCSANHPDVVKSDGGSSYRKAAALPTTARADLSRSSTGSIDCRNHCCSHHHITRNRPGCFKKNPKRYTSV